MIHQATRCLFVLSPVTQKKLCFRPAALIAAAAALHDIGHSIVADGKHPQRGAKFLRYIRVCSLSELENVLLAWLVENHNSTSNVAPPNNILMNSTEKKVCLRLLRALRQAELLQHEHVL